MSLKMQVIDDTASQMLANLSNNLFMRVHDKILETGGKMKEYSEDRCPVRTGYLRSTIYFVMVATLNYEFGASAYYAIFVEMGTWKMAAQPFIRPSVEAHQTEILEAIVKGVMEACKG